MFLLIFLFFDYWTRPNFNFPGSLKIYDRKGILLYQSIRKGGRKLTVNYQEIPQYLINAVISVEDQSFWQNHGIDFKGIFRSLYTNIKSRKIVSGGSTITQQLARMSFKGNKMPSLIRKIREILTALRINFLYSKKEILTHYLNNIYLGHLIYGVQAASLVYFDKDVTNLSLGESALLAGLIASPKKYDPYSNIDQARKRRDLVLELMEKQGYISSKLKNQAKKEEILLEKIKDEIKAPHFVFYILNELEKLKINRDQDLNVFTTLDYHTYQLAQETAFAIVSDLKEKHDLTNAALVLIENKTGELLVMMGGIDFFDKKNHGEVNMTIALRQPGSALKPFTYAAAFLKGETPASLIFDVKKSYLTKKGEGYVPQNYDGRYHGPVLIREALASSYNLPAVEILSRIGIKKFLRLAREIGLKSLNQENRYDLSLTLGGGEVTLLELTNAYATLARGGYYLDYCVIKKITNDKGKIILNNNNSCGIKKQVLGEKSEQIAYLITDILSDPKARMPGFGEKNPLVLSQPAAVKTGTTTDWHDNWTIGYTPSYTVGVWVGNNDNHPMKKISGILGAAPIWNRFFEEFLKDKPKEDFKMPKGIKRIEICATDGLLPDQLCQDRYFEIFIEGSEPKQKSKIHKKILIDKRNGLKATKNCPKEVVEEKVFVDYPKEVFSWAKENNLPVIPNEFSSFCPEKISLTKDSYLEIVYPVNKSIFEIAPHMVKNEKIFFELNVSFSIKKVKWFIDDNLVYETSTFPFSFSWEPKKGNHAVYAYGFDSRDNLIKSQTVNFSVLEFKEEEDY